MSPSPFPLKRWISPLFRANRKKPPFPFLTRNSRPELQNLPLKEPHQNPKEWEFSFLQKTTVKKSEHLSYFDRLSIFVIYRSCLIPTSAGTWCSGGFEEIPAPRFREDRFGGSSVFREKTEQIYRKIQIQWR